MAPPSAACRAAASLAAAAAASLHAISASTVIWCWARRSNRGCWHPGGAVRGSATLAATLQHVTPRGHPAVSLCHALLGPVGAVRAVAPLTKVRAKLCRRGGGVERLFDGVMHEERGGRRVLQGSPGVVPIVCIIGMLGRVPLTQSCGGVSLIRVGRLWRKKLAKRTAFAAQR